MLLVAAILSLMAAGPDFLLPSDAAPIAYRIELRIDPSQPAFDGVVRIEVDLRKPLTVIWLNAIDLAIREASVEIGGRAMKARVATSANEFLSLTFDAPIGPGRAVLSIHYQAKFTEKPPVGAFRRKVGDDWFVFTTFTPIDARRAFPCFDEPRFKSKWDLTIRVPRMLDAYANSPAARTIQEPDGWKAVHFESTETMPSELVAFAVGRFERLDGGRVGVNATPLGVITPPGRRADGAEAIRATRAVMPGLEAYTGIPYPYRKLDHIAMPEGAFGATENPGLITYRAASLLVPAGASADRLRALRGLQAHEIAHQWFGNLVTQASWDDVWLSEGFATWLSARLMDEEQPALRRRVSAIVARERIMEADAGDRAMPVRRTWNSRAEMSSVYNRFVYQKGAAVLLMLEAWIGEERFQKGLREYLRRHRWGAASTADLVEALRDATGVEVGDVLASFLDRVGVPSVRVAIACDGGKPRLAVEQSGPRAWAIPVCWKTDAGARGCAVVDRQSQAIDLGAACPAWVYPNADGAGYYRAEAMLPPTALDRLGAAERLTLAHDLRAAKRAGRLDADGERLLARLAGDAESEVAQAAKVP